jgi:hypothetical protein
MSTLSRTQFPPGGWHFFQPQTGWAPPTPIASTFDQTVQLIIKHRLANGGITAKHKLSLDPAVVGNELETFNAMRLGIPLESPKPMPPRPTLPQSVVAAVAAVKKMADGVALLVEWLPQGQTVAPDLSEKRASVCVTCPKNGSTTLTQYFTQPVSARLQKMVEARKDLKLQTSFDDKLGVCDVCLCPMKLKVHVPMDHILAKTRPETMPEFPDHCWIKRQDK